ncbi:UMP kinase [Patescibacteria group bacterium]|nr:MAG: UMP kinase [Patescibacteria group bacterium]
MEKTKAVKRGLLKLGGAAFGPDGKGLEGMDSATIAHLVNEIASVAAKTELVIVPGGGNWFRGADLVKKLKMDPRRSDYSGMLATVVNAGILEDLLSRACHGREIVVASRLHIPDFAEPFLPKKINAHLENGKIVILAGGTGQPRVSTDSAAVESGLALGVDIIIKATKVDGVFTSDPGKDPAAKHIPQLTHEEFVARKLRQLFDRAAVLSAGENGLPIRVIKFATPGNLERAVRGEDVGSLIYTPPVTK